jgi:hypothetical protein
MQGKNKTAWSIELAGARGGSNGRFGSQLESANCFIFSFHKISLFFIFYFLFFIFIFFIFYFFEAKK